MNKDFDNVKATDELKKKTLKNAKKAKYTYVNVIAATLVIAICFSFLSVALLGRKNEQGNEISNVNTNASSTLNEAVNNGASDTVYDAPMNDADASDTVYDAPMNDADASDSVFDGTAFENSSALAATSAPAAPMPEAIKPNNSSSNGMTASRLNDNTESDEQGEWLNPMQKLYQEYDSYGMSALNRIAVNVKNGKGEAVLNAKVTLYDGNIKVFTALTDKTGNAYLFYSWNKSLEKLSPNRVLGIVAEKDGVSVTANEIKKNVSLVLDKEQTTPQSLDIMFVIDATGSMGDELSYLNKEVKEMLKSFSTELDTLASINFYRDEGDDFVVRSNPFTAVANINGQFEGISANGGGDMPEAVHSALENGIKQHTWREDSVKIMFLVLDAHAHINDSVAKSLYASVEAAAEMGIRIVPVLSSGAGETCEIMCRELALFTGGQFVFLTDDSGIGAPHHKPTTEVDYEVKPLITVLKEVINDYI